MSSPTDQYNILTKALLPEELFNYFEIVKVDIDDKVIDAYLDESTLNLKLGTIDNHPTSFSFLNTTSL